MGYFFTFLGVIAFVVSIFFWGKMYFYMLAIGGFLSFVYGLKTIQGARKEGIKRSTSTKVDRIAGDKRIPTKICPNCVKEIEIGSKVCPFCNHHYQIIYSLTVFSPMDRQQRESLVRTLTSKTGKSSSTISLELDRGMVFKFTRRELYIKNRKIFENIGCRVRAGESLSDR